MTKQRNIIPPDSLLQLQQRLDCLPVRSPERKKQVEAFASLYAVSTTTIYRYLKTFNQPKPAHRSDRGKTRCLPDKELTYYCELIAALKMRTTNKQNRHISTVRAIEIIEEHGVETAQGLVKPPKGVLCKSTINRHIAQLGLDQSRLLREPVSVRFQAEHSNDCWQFDMSPSDLKHIDYPEWIDPNKGTPTLMLFSVVDDRSGVCYQEYRCVYGEDAESALRFLFNAMSAKSSDFPFQGRPQMIYLDNGPVAKSRVFQNVMLSLNIKWQTHIPAGKDGRRTTARSKGKVERAFRTVKEAHETLYHFHQPQTELQANEWLLNYLVKRYNTQKHRTEKHSRIQDWEQNLPAAGFLEMCSWEQFCKFAREPERRKVGADARFKISGTEYEVEPDMAGENVVLLWGLFDDEMYVEFEGQKFGPYFPVSGPIPLHRYRSFKRSKADEKADRIRDLAEQIGLPISALTGNDLSVTPTEPEKVIPSQPFEAELQEFEFQNPTTAKLAIADDLAKPLSKLSQADRDYINQLLEETLVRRVILEKVRHYFRNKTKGEQHAS